MPKKEDNRMYRDLSWTWPIISPPEDYADEASQFIKAIEKHSKIPVKTLLNLGCGGGHNDFHLKKRFQVTGIDISKGMLNNARKLNPNVTYLTGDMRSARLRKKFDSVIIADAIMYMLSEKDMLAAFKTAYFHLKPGGIFCTYVEELPEKFARTTTTRELKRKDDMEITLIEHMWDPDTKDMTFELTFIYIITENQKAIVEVDRHTCGIFPLATWKKLIKEAGFTVRTSRSKDEGAEIFFICLKSEI
ncbi:MAG: class I SAM-dependent methyltransferase [Thermoplasmata archaeon]|nr:class I SAM-dependent methyltransferase [Thermoplasmata archaeon]